MKDNEHEKPYRHSKLIKHLFKSPRVHALLLAALLGLLDIVVVSGVRPTDQIGELVFPLRVAVLLTIGTVVLTVGAVASFLSSLRDRMTQVGGQQEREQVAAEEADVFNVRSKAA